MSEDCYYAEVNENNIVTRILVVPASEHGRGEDYLANDLGLGGRWFLTEMDTGFRKQYATVGAEFIESSTNYPDGVFLRLKPWPTWVLDENYDYVPPLPKPTEDPQPGYEWIWSETTQEWAAVEWDYETDLPKESQQQTDVPSEQ